LSARYRTTMSPSFEVGVIWRAVPSRTVITSPAALGSHPVTSMRRTSQRWTSKRSATGTITGRLTRVPATKASSDAAAFGAGRGGGGARALLAPGGAGGGVVLSLLLEADRPPPAFPQLRLVVVQGEARPAVDVVQHDQVAIDPEPQRRVGRHRWIGRLRRVGR